MSDPAIQTNPFVSGSTPQQQERSLYEIIRLAVLSAQMELHTWLPAKVTKVYEDGFVDLQPLLERVYQDGTVVILPQAQHVMVCVPRGTNYAISVPVAVGDTGVALFCERSLDSWVVSGGIVDPQDSRTHDLSDPVFLPGIYPQSSPIVGANSTDFTLKNGGTTWTMQQNGKFKLAGAGNQELLTILSDTLVQLITIASSPIIGMPPSVAAALTAIQVRLTLIKG